MTTTPVPDPPAPRRPGPLVLAAAAVLLAVGCITLGPPGAVADARRMVMAVVEALAAPWPGTVQRAQVEAAANVLLFVPVGALAALVLRRRGPLLPLAAGAGTSVLIELVQNALPGRVPDLADVPAITRLDGTLRTAVQDASREAGADGVAFHVTTGWRSAAYQQSLFDAAVQEYGSAEAARAHVLPAGESAHVTGHAVDIGPTDAMSWLAQHGADFGLCQTYGNEMWHYEVAVERGAECPAPAPDPSAG